jgi:hypothetical protein
VSDAGDAGDIEQLVYSICNVCHRGWDHTKGGFVLDVLGPGAVTIQACSYGCVSAYLTGWRRRQQLGREIPR